MDPKRLLEQFLGGDGANRAGEGLQRVQQGMPGGALGGLAAGGVLGMLLGNKKARKTIGKLTGGAVGYGGAAALGALAYRAYQNWQNDAPAGGQATAPAPVPDAPPPLPPAGSKFLPAAAPAGNGRPFELALILAMIGAANADGHIGPEEQRAIFDKVGQLPLDAEDKAFVFDALARPPSLGDVAGLANGPEQAAELYLASRLAIDVDHPMEEAYLEALASRLALPGGLVEQLEREIVAVTA